MDLGIISGMAVDFGRDVERLYAVADALFADDIELYSMPYDFARHVVADDSHKALHGGCAELADLAAFDAYGMVMVFDAGQHVSGRAVEKVQSAYNSEFEEELERAEHGCPSDAGEFPDNIFGGETFVHLFDDANYRASGHSRAIAFVFEDCHYVRPGCQNCRHDIPSRLY